MDNAEQRGKQICGGGDKWPVGDQPAHAAPQSKRDKLMKKTRSAEDQALLDRLAAMHDDEIDANDIPEAPAENWAYAKRQGLYRPVKKPVTLRLDVDVVEWFKDHAEGGGYQTEINRVLRRNVAGAEAQG
jgi:uncharacterized protein (DUF4415 family)